MASEHRITLPAALSIDTVEALGNEIKAIPFSDNLQVVLDASQVDLVTTPGAQLLIALSKGVELHGGKLQILNSRTGVLDVFSQLGLSGETGKWEQVHT